jgi:hypothetical protein
MTERPPLIVDGIPADDFHFEVAADVMGDSRLWASRYKQMGFAALSDFHRDNAKAAERWMIKAANARARRI